MTSFFEKEKANYILETMPVSLFIVQADKIYYSNSAGLALSGYTHTELIGMNFWDLVDPDYQELINKFQIARQLKETGSIRYELKILTQNGTSCWIDVAETTIEFKGQQATLCTVFDITQRKERELLVEARHAQLADELHNALVQSVHNLGIFLDIDTEATTTPSKKETPQKVPKANRQNKTIGVDNDSRLTKRELEILYLVSQGMTNQAISDQLILSVKTIGNLMTTIFRKLAVKNRSQAVSSALQHRWLPLDDKNKS